MDQEIAIELKNVNKTFRLHHEKAISIFEYIISLFKKNNSFEEFHVLKDVSFSVKKGEMLGVIGFNGSGKTTLLKLMAQIYSPDSGSIEINGNITPFLGIGAGFSGELTAKDNIILYGAILGFTKKEIVSKIDSIIHFAELEKFLDTKLKKFSSGMYSRLAFSTAMSVDPDILLVDEVLAVGDINFIEKSFNALMDFKRRKKTIVLVSHNIEIVKKHCDRVIWLHQGRVFKDGNPLAVVEEYSRSAHIQK